MLLNKRFTTILLALLVLVSMLSVTAYATIEDTDFNYFTLYVYRRYLNPRPKDDYTPCYLRIEEYEIYQTVHIAAYGFHVRDKESSLKGNCTWDGYGNSVNYVSVMPEQTYLIRSNIKEQDYPYASLGFSTPSNGAFYDGIIGNEVSGVWSPDSSEYAQSRYPFAY